MLIPFTRHLCLVCLAALLPSAPVLAFGPDGHRIIADLAERRLSDPALGEVRRLLIDESEPTLAEVSNWADRIRGEEAWRHTARLHYVNFPRDAKCSYDAQRDCRDGRCVVAAIDHYAGVLGDRRRNQTERAQALRFLVHLVGDVHQPLHAGYGDDRGGNTFQIFYAGRGSNLHALWDGGILRSARLDWPDHAERLASRPVRGDRRWSSRAARRWAEESCRLIDGARIYPPQPGRLPAGYVDRQLPIVEQQIVLAGARLAVLLNSVLGSDRRP